jgi:hypothetical protein
MNGTHRDPSNAAALPLPAGAKRAGELNDRLMKQQELAPQAFDLLGRLWRAHRRGDGRLCAELLEQAEPLIRETGGAL